MDSTPATYGPGELITRYETHGGVVWMDHLVELIRDDGEQFAVLLNPGSVFHFHQHSLGRHPWARQDTWAGPQVLQIYRPATLYSVWMFFDEGKFEHWYLNFEAPVVRDDKGFHTDDYGLDLIIEPDGRMVWKDVEDLDAMRESGRMTADEVLAVLAAAREVTDEIRRGHRWWAAWDGWTPSVRF